MYRMDSRTLSAVLYFSAAILILRCLPVAAGGIGREAASGTFADRGISRQAMVSDTSFSGRKSPLALDASAGSDTEYGLDVRSFLKPGRNWRTGIAGGVSGRVKAFDRNGDGFADEPESLEYGLSNGWEYHPAGGVRLRFGFGAKQGRRQGGQAGYDRRTYSVNEPEVPGSDPWGTDVTGRRVNAYFGLGIPLVRDGSQELSLDAGYVSMDTDSYFGSTSYLSGRQYVEVSAAYTNEINENHRFAAGLKGLYDRYDDVFDRTVWLIGPDCTQESTVSDLGYAGIFGKYAFVFGKKFIFEAEVTGARYSDGGLRCVPEVSLQYRPVEEIEVNLSGGRKLGYASPLSDNAGVFLTGKRFSGNFMSHTLEDAWTFGGSIVYRLPIGAGETYLRFDYLRTDHIQQQVVDYERQTNRIFFYNLDGNRSFSDSYTLDFAVEPLERFDVSLRARYVRTRIELSGKGLVENPLTPDFTGEMRLGYATPENGWSFGIAVVLNGSCRVYDFMAEAVDEEGNLLYENGRTPVYPLLNASVSKKFRNLEIFVEGENLTDFRQKHVLLGTKGRDGCVNPRAASFDASALWGPVAGVRVFAGVRVAIK